MRWQGEEEKLIEAGPNLDFKYMQTSTEWIIVKRPLFYSFAIHFVNERFYATCLVSFIPAYLLSDYDLRPTTPAGSFRMDQTNGMCSP